MSPNFRTLLTVSAAVTLLAGCGASSSPSTSSPDRSSAGSPSASPSSPRAAAYNPTIHAADFDTSIDNPYFPLTPGSVRVLVGTRDGRPMRTDFVVTRRTRAVMGVKCVVVEDTVTSNGALVEKTEDWFAQKKDGSVWYFGENTAEYVNGTVSSTHGTWEAGVDGAVPGVIMHAHPKVGTAYYQEYRPGEAEDRAKILTLDTTVKVPAGTFSRVVTTEDSDPLNPDKTDKKWYAPGVGMVRSVRINSNSQENSALVKVTGP